MKTNAHCLRKIGSSLLAFSLLVLPVLQASADTQIFSNEQREENGNAIILDYDNSGGDVILQFGETLGEQIFWDDSAGQFVFTDDANVQGNLDVDGTITAGSSNIQITDATGNLDGSALATDSVDDTALDFGTGAGQINGADLPLVDNFDNSNSTDVQNVLEDLDGAITTANGGQTGTTSNSFILDTDDTGGNVTLQFGTTLNETFTWNNAASRFDLSDDLNVTGNITLTGTVDGVDVSALDSTVSTINSNLNSHTDGGANKHDASEIDVETAGNVTTVGDLETNLGSIDTAIGNRTYTSDNYVTDGQSLSASINALDQALAGLPADVQSIAVSMNDMTIQSDGSNNKVNVYTGSETGSNPHQYYSVKTTQGTMQDIELKFKVQLPKDFVDFSSTNDISFFYKTAGLLTASKFDILVEDADGDDAFLAAEGLALSNTSWTEYTNEFDGIGFNPAAGDYIYITVKGYATDGNIPEAGELIVNYSTQ